MRRRRGGSTTARAKRLEENDGDEIQRIKAGNPDISHREAFSAAAKNWAHFPHIHFGLMPDHRGLKKTSLLPQDHQRKDGLLKEGLYAAAAAAAAAANMGVAPY
ncbi:hypothetical protein OsI_34264 [Oryza sativa Indica Group]|uniref:YABBY protein C-terminal domain-containing protein n=1 Tax=Oryza sativa subsp. indica TaxID=39946 RepID=B8BHT1_ORYSI|nr:hypothetical protein OsI_34264 [Oryza sativa Indica Group]